MRSEKVFFAQHPIPHAPRPRLGTFFLLALALLLAPNTSRADVMFVTTGGDNAVHRIDPDGTVTTIATGFNNPQGIAIDALGNLFVANGGDNTIKKITPGGFVTTFATLGNSPVALAFDRSGNLYSAQGNAGSAYKITPAGVVSVFATGLNSPYGLAFDSQ